MRRGSLNRESCHYGVERDGKQVVIILEGGLALRSSRRVS